jgi:hypothetical protein
MSGYAQRTHTSHADPDAAEKPEPNSSFKNKSVVRAFAILNAFYSPDEWVSASELSRRAKIHEATLNRFMQSLLSVGAVVRDDGGKYRCVLFAMPGAPRGAVNSREH